MYDTILRTSNKLLTSSSTMREYSMATTPQRNLRQQWNPPNVTADHSNVAADLPNLMVHRENPNCHLIHHISCTYLVAHYLMFCIITKKFIFSYYDILKTKVPSSQLPNSPDTTKNHILTLYSNHPQKQTPQHFHLLSTIFIPKPHCL